MRELSDDGAKRVARTQMWARARQRLRDEVERLPATVGVDQGGNLWASLAGSSLRSLVIGSHVDSVANGVWPDGCLDVLADLDGVAGLRLHSEAVLFGQTRRLEPMKEGARCGRSLFGSSAAAGLRVRGPEGPRRVGTDAPAAGSARRAVAIRTGRARRLTVDAGGVATAAVINAQPGISTSIGSSVSLMLDQRHQHADRLSAMLEDARAATMTITEAGRTPAPGARCSTSVGSLRRGARAACAGVCLPNQRRLRAAAGWGTARRSDGGHRGDPVIGVVRSKPRRFLAQPDRGKSAAAHRAGRGGADLVAHHIVGGEA